MNIFNEQELFDSRKYFSDNNITCWKACLMSWTKDTPFDTKFDNIQRFNQLMEKRNWQLDNSRIQCKGCRQPFSMWIRRHHCRLCGEIYCHECCILREVACCYRPNLNIKTCQPCFVLYSERIHRFHALQSQWMMDEKRVSDCTIQNHPKLEDETPTTLKSMGGEDTLSLSRETRSHHINQLDTYLYPFFVAGILFVALYIYKIMYSY